MRWLRFARNDQGKRRVCMADFNEVVEARIEKIRKVLANKAGEYAKNDDRYHNFNTAARILGTTPEKALKGMLVKHEVSVMDLIDWAENCPEKLTSGLIDEKIGDNINYLILLEGMLKVRAMGQWPEVKGICQSL